MEYKRIAGKNPDHTRAVTAKMRLQMQSSSIFEHDIFVYFCGRQALTGKMRKVYK